MKVYEIEHIETGNSGTCIDKRSILDVILEGINTNSGPNTFKINERQANKEEREALGLPVR